MGFLAMHNIGSKPLDLTGQAKRGTHVVERLRRRGEQSLNLNRIPVLRPFPGRTRLREHDVKVLLEDLVHGRG